MSQVMFHLHSCHFSNCFKKWADNIIVSKSAICLHCGQIQEVKDEGEISEQACITLGIRRRRV